MKVFFRLFKIYLASVFNFKNFKSQIQKRKRKKSGEVVTKNSTLKIIGIVFLFVVLFAEFLFFFGMFSYGLYSGAKEIGNMNFLFEASVGIISLFTLFFGFMMISSSYYIGDIEEHLLSMPIKPRTLLASKFMANAVNSLITAVGFFVVLMIVYGVNEHPPVLFYVWASIISILIPLPILAFCYFVNILVMRFTRTFKNKNVIMTLNAILGILFAIGFNVLIQSGDGGFDKLAENMAVNNNAVANYGTYYPLTKLAGKILVDPVSFMSALNMLLFIVLSFALPVLVIYFMSNAYVVSLVGFNEKKVKKLESAEVSSFIKKKIREENTFVSFVKREVNTMNRTPVYLLNGPLSVILLPVIVIAINMAKGVDFSNMPAEVLQFMNSGIGPVIVGLAAGITGTMASVAQTALSRDAKFVPLIQSLPIDIAQYMYAKLVHAMLFVLVAMLFIIGFSAYVFHYGFLQILFACLVALPFSANLNLLGLFLDTARPKLHWDNPVAAMKQNTNVMIDMFSNLVILGLTGLVVFFAVNSYWWVLFIYFVFIPSSIFAILIKPYGIYAERKIRELEI